MNKSDSPSSGKVEPSSHDAVPTEPCPYGQSDCQTEVGGLCICGFPKSPGGSN